MTKISFVFDIFSNFISKKLSSDDNFFPLLTDLVMKIYENFKIIKKEEDCIKEIKQKLINYFNLEENDKIGNNDSIKIEKMNNLFEADINKIKKSHSDDIIETDITEKSIIINESIMSLKTGKLNKIDETNISYNEANNIDNILIDQFNYNFKFLGELFFNSDDNFNVKNNFENNLSLEESLENKLLINNNTINKNEKISFSSFKRNNIKNIIFDISSINYKEVLKYVQKNCFNLEEENYNLTKEEKMKIKIFFISYISYKIISENYNNIKKQGFEYKTIGEFYYRMSECYNKAIDGFNEMREKFQE